MPKRKRAIKGNGSKVMSVRIDETTLAQLRLQAGSEGRSISNLSIQLIKQGLSNRAEIRS